MCGRVRMGEGGKRTLLKPIQMIDPEPKRHFILSGLPSLGSSPITFLRLTNVIHSHQLSRGGPKW